MNKKTLFYLLLFICIGVSIFYRFAPDTSNEIINGLTNDTGSVELKLMEPTQQVVQSLSKYGITIEDQGWNDELHTFRVKATNQGETCILELIASISLKDGTTNTVTLYSQGDDFYRGQTTWFEGLVTDDPSNIRSIQLFSFDIITY